MSTTIILLVLNLILLVSLFVVGIWYSRHHHQRITDQINEVHSTVRYVHNVVRTLAGDVSRLKGRLKS